MATRTKIKPKVASKERRPVPAAVNALMRIATVADALDCSERQVRYMVTHGEFPKPDHAIGRNPRWTAGLVNAWIEDNRTGKGAGDDADDQEA